MRILLIISVILLLAVFPLKLVTGKQFKGSYKNEPKIVGGHPADRASTSFIASLRLTIEEEFFEFGAGHKCGGSLITENIVISAAHCFYVYRNGPFDKELRDPCDWSVVLGVYNRFTQENTTVVRSVLGLTIHNDYDDNTMENDIALLFLNESVPLKDGVIETVLLNQEPVEEDTECQASGWGRTAHNGQLSEELMTVDISVIDINVCNDTESYGGELYDGMLCVGNYSGGQDSCQGDSGGPLMCNDYLAGIVSWGYKCAEPNYPGIYTDVYYFTDWIIKGVSEAPQILADCYVEPSTENPISSTTPSTTPETTPSSEPGTTPSGAFRSEFNLGFVLLLLWVRTFIG